MSDTPELVQQANANGEWNLKMVQEQTRGDKDVATIQSDAVKYQADANARATIEEAKLNYKVQMKALEVRELEARLKYDVDIKQAHNDSIRAEASKIAAEAKETKAEADMVKAHAKADKQSSFDSRYGFEGNSGAYYHG